MIPDPPVDDAPEAPLFDDPACLPTSLASRSPQHRLSDTPGTPPGGSPTLGAAVDVVQFGPLALHAPGYGPDLFTEVLVGVPDAPLGHGGTGLVRWVTLDRLTGAFADPDRHAATEIPGPSGVQGFGDAVLAADVVAPFVTPPASPVLRRAQGQEVLVGAPGSADGGRVLVYQATYAIADVGAVDDRTVWQWQPFTTLVAPAGAGSAFGASLAVDRRLDPGEPAPYVAIGAPGANAVYIYSVDTPTSPPAGLTLVQTLTPGGLGAGFTAFDFGFALVIDDFDRDGHADLAIGAPGDAQAPPRVFVVPGARSGPLPFDASIPTALSPVVSELGVMSRFGEALDGGNLFPPQQVGADPGGPRTLVIGAPEAQGRGGVCWAAFASRPDADEAIQIATPSSSAVECRPSPFPHSGARFGAAVAVGNVSPVDPFADATSREALLHEVVVGAPGAPRIAWTSPAPFEADADSGPASGLVAILRGDLSGPFVPPPAGATAAERPLGERYLSPDVSTGAPASAPRSASSTSRARRARI